KKAYDDHEKQIASTMVMEERPGAAAEVFVLTRGEYDKPDKNRKVLPNVPAALPRLPAEAPANRLALARWLCAPEHPLTARVTVNRYWQQLFGIGLVGTSEDFGAQGEWPSHPELLDWLALDFIEHGWDIKRTLKQIVLSATYRQDSHVTSDLARRDRENRLMARGPRFRADAEVVRDVTLATSGLLTLQIGGRSVRPYQPPGIWEVVAHSSSNTSKYQRGTGEALFRRSLYTFWKRTAPPPGLMVFDAPTRDTCTARRPRTNTPLQALALMNDEQYIEAARKLAERILREGGTTPESRLTYGFRLVTARHPEAAETAVLTRVLDRSRERFQQDKSAAEKLLAVGESPRNAQLDPIEHAAYTLLANLLLNLDETITKE
ncbi:MAG: Planctomycete cytochrome, partial [Planctomycetaceae bacterium]|nr:Planctomycete cytochrome [Planctomycetaceae bacterium]